LVERLHENLLRVELQIYDARSQRFPEDLSLKHRVGTLLKRMGNYREAAHRFQESRNLPDFYLSATVDLGECLQHLKQYVKALHCYERAAEKSAGQQAALDLHKLALYRAGVLATGMKEWETAEQMLSTLVDVDAGYKDARARLDKLRQISDKN
jgi:tetratricopeptide (TPR) repeat protein